MTYPRDHKHDRAAPLLRWWQELLALAGFLAVCAVLLWAPSWGPLIDAWVIGQECR
jgi:hypothetical protein